MHEVAAIGAIYHGSLVISLLNFDDVIMSCHKMNMSIFNVAL